MSDYVREHIAPKYVCLRFPEGLSGFEATYQVQIAPQLAANSTHAKATGIRGADALGGGTFFFYAKPSARAASTSRRPSLHPSHATQSGAAAPPRYAHHANYFTAVCVSIIMLVVLCLAASLGRRHRVRAAKPSSSYLHATLLAR